MSAGPGVSKAFCWRVVPFPVICGTLLSCCPFCLGDAGGSCSPGKILSSLPFDSPLLLGQAASGYRGDLLHVYPASQCHRLPAHRACPDGGHPGRSRALVRGRGCLSSQREGKGAWSEGKHKLRASRAGVSVAGTGCMGIRCCGSLAQIMQESLPKYVICHCFLFLGERDLSREVT